MDTELVEPVIIPEYLDDYIDLRSPESDEQQIDYSSYYETIISNQESIIALQEEISSRNAEILNAVLGVDNILFLTIIVFAGFWLVKNVFLKFF